MQLTRLLSTTLYLTTTCCASIASPLLGQSKESLLEKRSAQLLREQRSSISTGPSVRKKNGIPEAKKRARQKKLVLKLEQPSMLLYEEEPNMSVLEQSLKESPLVASSANEEDEEITNIEEYLRRIQVGYLKEHNAPIIGYSFSRKSREARAADARAEVSTPVFWKEK